ncbi:homoserine kinase [Paramaledivibacter caminithermalis]|uniref:Homoserine kinase n=1 Tax=Paramaledivibacter caminithermalis (strain DSM 15212 / CIP 107654 / DViRD3) TaxID=1121301 RepID=A0A1M6KQF6_PARC5|nr:homoserine kinase [Paramaledivibacter caminithermalis]SHJ61141.1 homoserine kinase [Paramaledivibacter caminithermalis DSM 15212]
MIKVRVPATSANIGPGFDCLGVALNLYNIFYFEEIDKGLIIEGCHEEFSNEDNLIYISMKKCFEKIGYKAKGIKIIIKDNIPVSRGLGSSAACIVGGVIGANEIAGGVLSQEEILNLATEIEGHPDNVAPALLGGMTVAIQDNNNINYSRINVAKGLKFYAMIPDFKLSTKESRGVLPKEIPYKDGVFNVGRVSLLITALTNGEFNLLRTACDDRLHQNYRGKLIDGFDEIKKKCEDLSCLGVFLSGAGPTIMALLCEDGNENFYIEIQEFLNTLSKKWEVKSLDIDFVGAKVL